MMKHSWIVTSVLLAISATGPSRADRIELSTGDVLVGKILRETEEQVVLEHPLLGSLTLPRQEIQQIARDDDESPPAPAAAKQQAAAPADMQARPTEKPEVKQIPAATFSGKTETADNASDAPDFFAAWKSTLDLGISGEEGSTRRSSFRVSLRSRREVEENRTRFSAAYHLGTHHSRRTRQEFSTSLGNDWLMPDSPWFFFAQGQYQYDEFKDWRHRLSGDGGAGYQFLDTPSMKLAGRTGPGASLELDGQRQGLRPEWMAGIEWEWLPADRHKITFSNVFVHDLMTLDRYRNKSTATWTIRLDQVYPVNLRFSVENEYDSSPLSGRTYNDLKYFGSLQWEF